jgi:hypothetical protein
MKKHTKEKQENMKITEYKHIVKMQVESMKEIDFYYQNIRKKNHDFLNHCITTTRMFNDQKEEVKDYIQSIIKYYQ